MRTRRQSAEEIDHAAAPHHLKRLLPRRRIPSRFDHRIRPALVFRQRLHSGDDIGGFPPNYSPPPPPPPREFQRRPPPPPYDHAPAPPPPHTPKIQSKAPPTDTHR